MFLKIIEVYQCDPTIDGQGGGVRYLQMLTQELRKRSEVTRVLFLGQGTIGKKNNNFEFIPVVAEKCNYVLFALKLFKFALDRSLMKGSIVHVHRLYFGLPFALLRWWNGCQVVCTMHGRTFEVFKEKQGGLKLRVALMVFRLIEKTSIWLIDFLVPVSQDVVSSFENKYNNFENNNRQKLRILASMVDVSKFSSRQSIKKIKSFCFVGRLSYVKDIPFLIRLVKKHKLFFESNAIQINIYGEGERKLELTEAINLDGVSHLLVLKGETDIDGVNHVFNESLATIICSRHEASPTVAIESIACGTPVISNDIGDIKSLLAPGGLGLVVEKDPDSYLSAIKDVLDGYDFSIQNANELINTRTSEFVTDQYIKIFSGLISAKSSSVN